MDLNFSAWSSQSLDLVNITLTSSARQAELTASSGNTKTEHGCRILEGEFTPQDNPENMIGGQAALWISTIGSGGLIPLLFVVGVPGNLLSAAVFHKQGLRERINLCVFCLALVDLVVITVTFFLSAEQVYRTFVGPSSFFIKYFVGLTGFIRVSMFLSAVIAAERCFCVVSPLHAQRMLSTRTLAVVIIIISLLLLTGMLVIAGPKHTEACLFDPKTNTKSQIVSVTEYYKKNKEILDLFDVFVYATALPAIFLITIIVNTLITIVKLRSARKWRQRTSSASQAVSAGSSENYKDDRQVALTWMLVATSMMFMVCLSPMLIVQVVMFLVPDLKYGGRYHNLMSVLWSIISVFRCINSSLNFFVYYAMGSRFRQTLQQLLACKRSKINMTCSAPEDSSKCSKFEHGNQNVYSLSGNKNGTQN